MNTAFKATRFPSARSTARLRLTMVSGVALAALSATSAAFAADVPAAAGATASATPDVMEEILVTATRRSENIRRVAVNVTAYSQAQMDRQGIKQIDDLARYTPGLTFTTTSGVEGNNAANISIRGISSDVGAATTAIYIDDTPIQVRSIGYFAANPYPRIFDLERVEVLRGPQGTLFGASAEGGAVRFITPQPSLTDYSGYVRTELATTEHGSESYEVGAAVGGPIVQDKLGFRVSVWNRKDGGYIDREPFRAGYAGKKDANSQETFVVRAALTFQPTEALKITPSILYQNLKAKDRDQYWESLSSPSAAQFVSGNVLSQPTSDHFVLPALAASYDLGPVTLVSNTSYFDRSQNSTLDYTNFQASRRYGDPYATTANDIPGTATVTTQQKTFTQDLRLQSNAQDSFISWSAGLFYSKAKQNQQNYTLAGKVAGVQVAGMDQLPGGYSLVQLVRASDEQIAGYANLDFHLSEKLKVTAGARISRTKFDFNEIDDGPINGGRTDVGAVQTETPFTPKIGVSYQLDAANFFYATAAKGFRPGGAQAPAPTAYCASDLGTLGLTESPRTYKSDSLWSYELGGKNDLLGGRLQLDSSAYVVKWKNIQQSVDLPNCGYSYVANLGAATSRGADISAVVRVTPMLKSGVNLGYNKTTYDQDLKGGSGSLIAADGDRIGGPAWTGTLWTQADFTLAGKDSYLRVDYTFQSKGISRNPATFSYDPDLTALPSTDNLSARLGVNFDGFDLSVFANNITNSNSPLSRTHDLAGITLYYASTYRPRTIGLTAQRRF